MIEIWKDIDWCPGRYQISNLGNVKSLSRYAKGRVGKLRFIKERLLTNTVATHGYPYVRISAAQGEKFKPQYVHRLIAIAFIPNPDKLPCINHINGIRTDYRIENLEWCTFSQNSQHAFDTGLNKQGTGADNKASHPVLQFDLQGKFIQEFVSIREAACFVQKKATADGSTIGKCCRNLKGFETAYGFRWAYKYKSQNKPK